MIAVLLAGLVDAVGGAYKDYPLEGFKWTVFPRSFIFAICVCWIPFSEHFIVSFLCGGYVVRALVEIKKYLAAKGDYAGYWKKRIDERKDER